MATDNRTAAERRDAGRHARATVPRRAHATWAPAADRPDPVSWLEEQARTRVPDLVPVRHGRMLASPFAFFRGSALLMASDLATTPASGFDVQACGDAHISNFGLFASPERRLVFDINDFDETHVAPWEWDVKRMAASIAIAGRENGFAGKHRYAMVRDAVATYRAAVRRFAEMGDLDVWYAHATVQEGLPRLSQMLDRRSLEQARKVVAKAVTKDNRQALARLTQMQDGGRRIVSDPPLLMPVEELVAPERAEQLNEELTESLQEAIRNLPDDRRALLERYRFVQMARKVVGVGSVGTRAWVLLMLGRDDDDPLLLQAKEAEASVLERFTRPSRYREHGRRVVEGQKLMQAASDVFLSWTHSRSGLDGQRHDFYLRQLHDWKGSWDPATMNPVGMRVYAQMCAWTLARAHARTGDRIAIAAYLGASDAFDRAVAAFAEAYAEQNEQDYSALQKAVADGRIHAETGV